MDTKNSILAGLLLGLLSAAGSVQADDFEQRMQTIAPAAFSQTCDASDCSSRNCDAGPCHACNCGDSSCDSGLGCLGKLQRQGSLRWLGLPRWLRFGGLLRQVPGPARLRLDQTL